MEEEVAGLRRCQGVLAKGQDIHDSKDVASGQSLLAAGGVWEDVQDQHQLKQTYLETFKRNC